MGFRHACRFNKAKYKSKPDGIIFFLFCVCFLENHCEETRRDGDCGDSNRNSQSLNFRLMKAAHFFSDMAPFCISNSIWLPLIWDLPLTHIMGPCSNFNIFMQYSLFSCSIVSVYISASFSPITSVIVSWIYRSEVHSSQFYVERKKGSYTQPIQAAGLLNFPTTIFGWVKQYRFRLSCYVTHFLFITHRDSLTRPEDYNEDDRILRCSNRIPSTITHTTGFFC